MLATSPSPQLAARSGEQWIANSEYLRSPGVRPSTTASSSSVHQQPRSGEGRSYVGPDVQKACSPTNSSGGMSVMLVGTSASPKHKSRKHSPIVKPHSTHVYQGSNTQSLGHSTTTTISSQPRPSPVGSTSISAAKPCASAFASTSTSTYTPASSRTANSAISSITSRVTAGNSASTSARCQTDPDSAVSPRLSQSPTIATATTRSTGTQTSPPRFGSSKLPHVAQSDVEASKKTVMVDASTQYSVPSSIWQQQRQQLNREATTPTSPIAKLKLREQSETSLASPTSISHPTSSATSSTLNSTSHQRSSSVSTVDATVTNEEESAGSRESVGLSHAHVDMSPGLRPSSKEVNNPRSESETVIDVQQRAASKRNHSAADTTRTKASQDAPAAAAVAATHAEDNTTAPTKKMRPADPEIKIMPVDYSAASTRDLVLLISSMLMELIRYNDTIPLHNNQLTRFHSRAPPGISVVDYLQRLTTHATLSPPILLSMVYYIDKLCALYPAFTISSLTVHRFLITAATVASKGLSDSFWTNKTYAKVGGVSFRELALLELEFLVQVQWRIVPQPEVLVEYYRSLVQRTAGYTIETINPGSTQALSNKDEDPDNSNS